MTSFYQTPAMAARNAGAFLPCTIVPSPIPGGVAFQKPNGKYLTVLNTGQDAESPVILDQETFFPDTSSGNLYIADRTDPRFPEPRYAFGITVLNR